MEENYYGAHVLAIPYPSQGHISPMHQFCRRLVSKGVKTSLAITNYISTTLNPKPDGYVRLVTISDGYDDGGFFEAESIAAYLARLEATGSQSIGSLIEEHVGTSSPITCIVYDAFFPWCLNVAKKYGLLGAAFFTQACAVNYFYCLACHGKVSVPVSSTPVDIPGLPPMDTGDLPSFIGSPGTYPAYFELVLSQFSTLDKADFVLVNTVYKLEAEVIKWMTSQWPVKTIGPCIPSMYLDKRLPNDKDYGLSLFQPQTDACIQWLDAREIGSVVYISMGSLASLGSEQMQEIAQGLENCNNYFLWVVRASEEDKLPLNFKEKVSDKGLIINWCPQLEVLAHKALGCFVTHCGWNSTLEAISLGVPMIAFPQWTDQPTNAKCIVDFWEIGVRVKVDEKGFLKADELEC